MSITVRRSKVAIQLVETGTHRKQAIALSLNLGPDVGVGVSFGPVPAVPPLIGNSRGDAPSWDVGPGETIADVIAEFDEACAESRRIAAAFALDHTVPHDQLGRVSLRWIYVHMIREHARHGGHADILREQIDGSTGD